MTAELDDVNWAKYKGRMQRRLNHHWHCLRLEVPADLSCVSRVKKSLDFMCLITAYKVCHFIFIAM